MTAVQADWTFGVTDDVALPGWVFLPERLAADAQPLWLERAAASVRAAIGDVDWAGEPIDDSSIREGLVAAYEVRSEAPAVAMFQVWPLPVPASVLCHVSLLSSEGLPDWTTLDDVVVHPIDDPNLGAGVQCVVRRVEELGDGESIDLVSIHLVFADGDTTLMLSLDEAPAPLIGAASPGLAMLASVLTVRRDDGHVLRGTRAGAVDGAWPDDLLRRPTSE